MKVMKGGGGHDWWHVEFFGLPCWLFYSREKINNTTNSVKDERVLAKFLVICYVWYDSVELLSDEQLVFNHRTLLYITPHTGFKCVCGALVQTFFQALLRSGTNSSSGWFTSCCESLIREETSLISVCL